MIPGLGAYYRPERLEEALALLGSEPDCEVLAGGTDLLLTHTAHAALVDVTRCGLDRIEPTPEGLHVGATATVQMLLESPHVAGWADGVLVGAGLEFGTLQVRNMATVGGNIAHALPAADLVPALLALDAEVELARSDEKGAVVRRRLPLDGFAIGPFRTVLEPGELLTGLCIPAGSRSWRAQFRKIGRVQKDLAQANCAVAIEVSDDIVRQARIAVGAVHPTVIRVRQAEAVLVGTPLGGNGWTQRVTQAIAAVRASVEPITDQRATREWRRHVIGVLVERCLEHCADGRTAGRVPRLEEGPSYCAGLRAELGS